MNRAPPSEINPRVAPELERIILKCMEKEPSNRYQSAQELLIDLRRLDHATEERFQDRKANFIWGRAFLRKHTLLVAAVGLVIVAAILVRYLLFTAPASIAVLPFEDLSPTHDQEFFSKGLAEEIMIDLSNVPELRVAGRPSSFQIAAETGDLRVIGKKLNVANVLQGSVQRVGDRVRIRGQLVKTSDGFRLWAQSYDRDMKDIFQLEQEIGQAVAEALRGKLIPKEKAATQKTPPTANSEAHLAFLQARYFWHMDEEASLRKALQYTSRAIELDPSFAQAYALRADIVQDLGGMACMDITEAITESHSDAQKAIELAPNLPDGYRALSTIRARTDSNCPAAQELLKKARALAPANPDTLALSAQNAVCLGQLEEAVSLYGETLALDPLRLSEYMFKAQVLRDLGRYEEAEVELNKALELNPRNPWLVHETWGEVYMRQGRLQEALAEMEKEPAGYAHEIGMALVHQAFGQRADSDAALNELLTRYPNETAYQIAQVYAYRGEVDQALVWLDRAYRQHDPGLMWQKRIGK